MCTEYFTFENDYAILKISKNATQSVSIYDKTTNTDITGDSTDFFTLFDYNGNSYAPDKIVFEDGIFSISTDIGSFDVSITVNNAYFVFELLTKLPEKAYKAHIAHIRYRYEYGDKSGPGAVGISMTWWANHMFFPDAKDRETCCEILSKKDIGAKYALMVAPFCKHKDIIKEIYLAIDKSVGIVNPKGGIWSRDVPDNYGNVITDFNTRTEWINDNIPYYQKLGVDVIDYHKNFFGDDPTFRQGDFKPLAYDSDADFKANVSDVLEKNGMCASLHTYAYLIDFDCDALLCNPAYQKDLKKVNTYTLSESIDINSEYINIEEPVADINLEYGFLLKTTPYFLIGNEIIKAEKCNGRIKIINRCVAKTPIASLLSGEKIYQLGGLFGCFNVELGSDLFLEVARQTARAYNDCGYKAIYVDAIDSVTYDCDGDESEMAFYISEFIHEILTHCKTPPMLDYSIRRPCNWAGRYRVGNYDTPYRAYKQWNKFHINDDKKFIDMYLNPSLGWYNFYGMDNKHPENYETKYQHTDDVEHIGSLALMYNCSMTYVEFEREKYDTIPALRRNIEIYSRYDKLRKAAAFSEDTLEKVRNGKYEYHINGNNKFTEKDYQKGKIYDLADGSRNSLSFNNPFESQSPFVRIEALLSCNDGSPEKTIISLDKTKPLTEQCREISYDNACLDLSDMYARKVSILGNGKNGAVAIKLRCKNKGSKLYTEYIIDTNFTGWRDFVLAETDKGERPDLPFDDKEWNYATYRFGFNYDKIEKVEIETAGDVSGVQMSDVVALSHSYEYLKNPSLKIGDSQVSFKCELKSSEFIEFDGKTAKVVDKYGNEKIIEFSGSVEAPSGSFKASLDAAPANGGVARAQLTLGFTGAEID